MIEKTMIENGQVIEYDDRCPVHDKPIKKSYDFGRFTAQVDVFFGCNCAVCLDVHSIGGDAQYYSSYEGAAGRARMLVAQLISRGL